MRVDAFDYDLPQELIAQRPAADREEARLLHVPPGNAPFEHGIVGDLASVVPDGALLVVNDTRVLPARILARKPETGGRVEIFLVRHVGSRQIDIGDGDSLVAEVWRALGKATKALRFGTELRVASRETDDRLRVRLLGRSDADGLLEVALWSPIGGSVRDAVHAVGHVPLPPYIKRDDDSDDQDRYQTIFARVDGAIAAPTAGLHLTTAILGRLAARGCEVTSVTLHVGLGTFQPVTVDDLDAHPMHTESFRVSRSAAALIANARETNRAVVAVGTTVVRALESAADPDHPGLVRATEGDTRILIQPGYAFRVVDALVTNFHLPRSTLLAMVCAFAGRERVLAAYAEAVRERYRFFSYGDAMLLHRATP
jgi:S-adenosylmethionine:tRNA ribosyltransferase-isomerase